jgi:hypothetical protein
LIITPNAPLPLRIFSQPLILNRIRIRIRVPHLKPTEFSNQARPISQSLLIMASKPFSLLYSLLFVSSVVTAEAHLGERVPQLGQFLHDRETFLGGISLPASTPDTGEPGVCPSYAPDCIGEGCCLLGCCPVGTYCFDSGDCCCPTGIYISTLSQKINKRKDHD